MPFAYEHSTCYICFCIDAVSLLKRTFFACCNAEFLFRPSKYASLLLFEGCSTVSEEDTCRRVTFILVSGTARKTDSSHSRLFSIEQCLRPGGSETAGNEESRQTDHFAPLRKVALVEEHTV